MLGNHLFIQNKICRIFIAFHDISVHRCSRRTNHRAVFLWQPFEIARVVRWSEGNFADVSQLSCDSYMYDCRWTNVRASWEISWTCFGHADTSAVLTFFNCIALFMKSAILSAVRAATERSREIVREQSDNESIQRFPQNFTNTKLYFFFHNYIRISFLIIGMFIIIYTFQHLVLSWNPWKLWKHILKLNNKFTKPNPGIYNNGSSLWSIVSGRKVFGFFQSV